MLGILHASKRSGAAQRGWVSVNHPVRYIGRERNRAWFKINAAVYNLIRITALDAATT